MNRLTTAVLLAFLAVLAALYYYATKVRPAPNPLARPRILEGFDPAAVSELFFEHLQRGTRASFRRVPGGWDLTQPLVYPGESAVVEAILQPFQYNECALVGDPARPPGLDLEAYGLKTPRGVIRLTMGGAAREVLVGSEDISGNEMFVLADGRVLRTSKNLHNALERTVEEMRSKRIFTLPFRDVREFEVDRGALRMRFRIQGNNWYLDEPWQERADAPAVNAFLAALVSIQVRKFHDDHPTEDRYYGLDPPEFRVLVRAGGSREELKIGHDSAGFLLGKRTDFPFVWELAEEALKLFEPGPEQYRDHGFFRAFREEMEEIRIGARSGEIVFVKKLGFWNLAAPREYPIERAAVEDLIAAIEKLQAVGFAEQREQGFAAFGLDAPSQWIQIRAGKEGPVKLWVGKEDGGGSRFVRRQGEDTVLLVDAGALSFLDQGVLAYVSRSILHLSDQEIRRIEVVAGDKGAAWLRDSRGRWKRLDAAGKPGEEEDARFVADLDYLLHWKGNEVLAEDPSLLEGEAPAMEIRFFADAGEGSDPPLRNRIVVGKDPAGKLLTGGVNQLVYSLDPKVLERIVALLEP